MRFPHGLALALLAILGAACGGVPATHYYVLEASDGVAAARAAASAGGLTIGVAPFEVDPPYDQDRIVYRVGVDTPEVGFYAYHRWAAPLGRMLPRVVADGLRGVSGIRDIEPAGSHRSYDALLTGRVLQLEEIDTPDGEQVRVLLRLRLVVDGREVWTQNASGRGSARAPEVGDVVLEMRRTLSDAVHGVRGDLETALRGQASRLDRP